MKVNGRKLDNSVHLGGLFSFLRIKLGGLLDTLVWCSWRFRPGMRRCGCPDVTTEGTWTCFRYSKSDTWNGMKQSLNSLLPRTMLGEALK
jgi:hypothetical protein